MRGWVTQLVEARRFQQAILVVILINAVTLGAETSPALVSASGGLLEYVDRVALTIFVVELLAKLYAYRWRFFRDPWNVFDFLVVGVSLVPAAGAFSVLRALRVLRVLRVISVVPSMRRVVSTLLAALPGVASIVGLLILVTYVAGVMGTKLFGEAAPHYFGGLGRSLWTLFQTMTGEAWPDIADEVMAEQPLAWIFFLIYILVSTFVVLNLFLAVVVNAMESVREAEAEDATAARAAAEPEPGAGAASESGVPGQAAAGTASADPAVLAELAALRHEVAALRDLITTAVIPRQGERADRPPPASLPPAAPAAPAAPPE